MLKRYNDLRTLVLGTDSKTTVMIAGGTGLVGTELVKLLLEKSPIEQIYALTRKPLPFHHTKLTSIIQADLTIHDWDESMATPTIGFICLGSTRKQAKSKAELERIDYHLVCSVAQQMKAIGIKKIAVVSSYGASLRTPSHYLRCKGKMEFAIEKMGFEQVTFVRPGPLKGLRDIPRKDEAIVQSVLNACRPILIGRLANFIPITATEVAQSMLYSTFSHHPITHKPKTVQYLNSIDMRLLLKKYQ
ncbi:NAD-dependent epimerase/dehydratase family protein [Vibrio sinensis]|uniref:NAD-dependent epimerase/dehydratase family protein n=1 Tax=Vibrio sinensis TaxID=2302434 RepID=A0A3A6R8Y9_9VIBR|nr:NAD(P)H-binding protein [Vibrio sinensis]RJX72991.1 NAD-dependent epimerase/dehydratase family protein [Vibrio sinensis]